MGNSTSKAEQLHYDPKEWEEVQRSTFYEVMRSRKGQQGNLYHFNIKSHRELDEEVDLYDKRRKPANWVQVIGANLSSGGFGFCGNQESALVLTERIPLLLNAIPRLNKQESLVVLYNALRGFNDISRLSIVPGHITDRMIGFTKDGETKVWVNENFGMNYPSHFIEGAKLDEATVVSNLVSAISQKADIDPQLASVIRSSGSFSTALGFIKSKGGVSQNVLEANRINVTSYLNLGSIAVLNNTTSVVQPALQTVVQTPVVHQTVQPVVTSVVNQSTVVPQYVYQPTQTIGHQSYIPGSTTQSSYRSPSVQFTHTPGFTSNIGTGSTYQPSSYGYQPVRV